jgi:hypothetical protein
MVKIYQITEPHRRVSPDESWRDLPAIDCQGRWRVHVSIQIAFPTQTIFIRKHGMATSLLFLVNWPSYKDYVARLNPQSRRRSRLFTASEAGDS